MREVQAPRISVVTRLPWLLSLEALLLVIVVYPLYLRETWLRSLVGGWELRRDSSWLARLALTDLEPLLTFHFSPLILKGTLASSCLLILAGILVGGRFIRSFAPGVLPEWRPRSEARPIRFFLAWLAFVVWSALSAMWSPTPGLSSAAVPWLLVFGLFGYMLLRRGIAVDEARQLVFLMMGLGALISVISIFEATRMFGGFIFDFLHHFADPRNAYGSLMGHNTAVASFLLMTLFPTLATASITSSRLTRWIARFYVALALVTLVLVQSRAAWLIAPPLLVTYLFALGAIKRRSIRPLATLLLGLLAFAVLSQSISASWNPLYLRERPVARRLKDLSLEQLQKEARLRLFICSIPLVMQKPFIGHGLYSFQYVYPPVQGDYFAEHPDTKLGYTNKRSHMAHNEYLQVTVEQGLAGLGLMLFALGEIFWRGRRLRAGLSDEERILQAAFGFSALGLALGAVVDFPFHIPQLVLPWLFCLAAFGAMTPGRGSTAGAEGDRSSAPGEPKEPRFRVERVFGLTLGFVVLFLVPLGNYFFEQSLAIDSEFLHASSYLTALQRNEKSLNGDQAVEALEGIMQHLRHVILIQPSHANARFLLGEAYYTLGYTVTRLSPGSDLEKLKTLEAGKAYQAAIQYISESMQTLRTHHSFYMLALVYRGMARISTPEKRGEYLRSFQAQLENSVHYAPAYEPALYLLSEWLAMQPHPDRVRIATYRRAIRRHAPAVFEDKYLNTAIRLIQLHDWNPAVQATEGLFDVDPADPQFLNLLLFSRLNRGTDEDMERVRQVADLVLRAADQIAPPGEAEVGLVKRAHLYRAAAEKDWAGVLQWVGGFDALNFETRAWLRALEWSAQERLGLAVNASVVPPPEAGTEDAWRTTVLEMRLVVLARIFKDDMGTASTLDQRLKLPEAPPIAFWADVLEWSRASGRTELLERATENLKRLAPAHSVLRENASPVIPEDDVVQSATGQN